MQRALRSAGLIATVLVAQACKEPPAPTIPIVRFADEVLLPAALETASDCFDLGAAHRVCFEPELTVTKRPPVPAALQLPSDAHLRCRGDASERTCRVLRERPFACAEGDDTRRCEQVFPRVPDDGEWECADVDGLVVCRGRSEPAGVVPGPLEPGWICGQTQPRICVDLSPDLPDPLAEAASCRFDHAGVMRRVCRASAAPRLGGSCSTNDACPRAMACVQGVCVPRERPRPSCWTAVDCASGQACLLATCTEDS